LEKQIGRETLSGIAADLLVRRLQRYDEIARPAARPRQHRSERQHMEHVASIMGGKLSGAFGTGKGLDARGAHGIVVAP